MEVSWIAQEKRMDGTKLCYINLSPYSFFFAREQKEKCLRKQGYREHIQLNCYVRLNYLSFVTMSYFQWPWARQQSNDQSEAIW